MDNVVKSGGRFMKENITLRELQQYVKEFDFNPNQKSGYFLKLIEEIGELAETIRKDTRLEHSDDIKGTMEEELSDVLYYIVAIANIYDIDLENSFRLKDEINKDKWGR